MIVNKFIVFIIVASIHVCDHTIAADGFTLEEFIGVWYEMGVITTNYARHESLKCNWFNITKRDDSDKDFNQLYCYTRNGHVEKIVGRGRIVDSKVHIEFPDLADEIIYTVVSYNNDGEYIGYVERENFYGLLSRSRSISAETEVEFDKLATYAGVKALYYNQKNCPD